LVNIAQADQRRTAGAGPVRDDAFVLDDQDRARWLRGVHHAAPENVI
jgi:hypothetical protein